MWHEEWHRSGVWASRQDLARRGTRDSAPSTARNPDQGRLGVVPECGRVLATAGMVYGGRRDSGRFVASVSKFSDILVRTRDENVLAGAKTGHTWYSDH